MRFVKNFTPPDFQAPKQTQLWASYPPSNLNSEVCDLVFPMHTELQKRADRADQSVLFFMAGANFWEQHAKNRRKHAKTGEKQALFWC